MGTLPPNAADVLFLLLGAIMILAMHAGFAFLELGTVRKKNQVNALAKILSDFAVSAIAYFAVGYSVAYGVNFFAPASALTANHDYELVKFFFLLTFAARDDGRRPSPPLPWSVWCIRFLKASPGTTILACKTGLPPNLARPSMILPARWWCTPLAAGLPWPPCCCSARAMAAITKAAACRPTRRPASRFWPWVPGF
jgi:hypothetical protein